ncbi:MAG: four helix bundle protein [Candidatus Omnitrophica bacterium]|nr:four helix bundle protein [Candidatus Omnitrophota bacterium]
MKSYKELGAYQKSYDLVIMIYKMTQKFPKDEMYTMTSQIRRSAISIPSNIAEGYMRGSKEYIQFLKIALGSCAELETQLSLSKDISLCNQKEYDQAISLLSEVIKLLMTYVKRIGKFSDEQESDSNRSPLSANRY